MDNPEPTVIATDGVELSYSDARRAWESGEFSAWIEEHGFPVEIAGVQYDGWDGVEDALSDDEWDD